MPGDRDDDYFQDEQDWDEAPPSTQGGALGILALIFGILGLFTIILGPVGLILGILGVRGRHRGMAITGIVLGGLGTLMVPFAIIAAIAIPNLLESRVVANENAAAATLKSGIFPGLLTYQSGAWTDADQDDRGEYSSLAVLAEQELLGQPFAQAERQPINGYHYRLYLLDGDGDAFDAATAAPQTATAIDLAEKYFIVYAWPASYGDTGRRVFCLTQDGQVLTAPPGSVDLPPSADAAFSALTPEGLRDSLWSSRDW